MSVSPPRAHELCFFLFFSHRALGTGSSLRNGVESVRLGARGTACGGVRACVAATRALRRRIRVYTR